MTDRTLLLERLLDRLLDTRGVQHALIAVESIDRSFRWTGAGGSADPNRRAMKPNTPYFIASIDKMLTATVVMRLVEQRRIALDDPVGKHLPEGLMDGLHRIQGVDHSARLTIRHLLSHTSGLPCYLEDRPRVGPKQRTALVDSLIMHGDRAWTIENVARIVRDDLRPWFEPQADRSTKQKVRYSDTNYALLIAVIEQVETMPIENVFHDTIFEPLRMRHSWLPGRSNPGDPATPEPATVWFDERPVDIPLAFRSLPAVCSTAADQLTFMRALTQGELFSDPGTFRMMQARFNRFGLPLDAAALRAPSWPIEYGLGIKRVQLPPLFTRLRRLPELIGHSGSTGTWLFHCPRLDILLAGTVDQASAGAIPYRLMPRILRDMMDRAQ